MGFLDIFRKKNEVTKSVGSSLRTTEKLLGGIVTDKKDLEKKRQEFWNSLSPLWKVVLVSSCLYDEFIESNLKSLEGKEIDFIELEKKFWNDSCKAKQINIMSNNYIKENDSYPENLFDIKMIRCSYNKADYLPDFSLFKNVRRFVLYEGTMSNYSNLSTLINLEEIAISNPVVPFDIVLDSIQNLVYLRKVEFFYGKLNDINKLFYFSYLSKIVLAGIKNLEGKFLDSDRLNSTREYIREKLPSTSIDFKYLQWFNLD